MPDRTEDQIKRAITKFVEQQIEDLIARFAYDLDDAGYVAALEEMQSRADTALVAFREEHPEK